MAFLFIIAVGAIFGNYYSYQNANKILEENVHAQLETIAHSRADHIADILKTTRDQLRIQTTRKVFKDNLSNINAGINVAESKEKLQESIDAVNAITNVYYDSKIMDKNGIIIASNYKEKIGKDSSDKEFFIQAMAGATFMLDAHTHNNIEVIGFAKAIFNDANEAIGVFLIHQAFDSELNAREGADRGVGINTVTLSRTGLGATGKTYLVNKDRHIITPPDSEGSVVLKQKVDTENSRNCFMHATHSKEEIEKKHAEECPIVFQDYRGVKVIGTHVYLPEAQWCLLAEISEEEAIGIPRNEFIKSSLISACILFIFGSFVGFFIAKKITKPIETLKNGAQIIGNGNLEHRIDIKSGNEIEDLANAFNNMTAELRKSKKELAKYTGELEDKVDKRTNELNEKVKELEKYFKLVVGRELKMVQLKRKIEDMKGKK